MSLALNLYGAIQIDDDKDLSEATIAEVNRIMAGPFGRTDLPPSLSISDGSNLA